jgi:hypothetical protein
MDRIELAKALTRSAAAENKSEKRTATVQVSGVATSDSADGVVMVDMGGDSVTYDDTQAVPIPTTVSVKQGDTVSILLTGAEGTAKTPLVIGVVGRGDETQTSIEKAQSDVDEAKTDIAQAQEDISGAKASIKAISDKAIAGVDIEYAQSTSNTDAPTSGWQTDAPAWKEGTYIWQRTATTNADGVTSYSAALCITGVKGERGDDGDDAVSLYIESSNGTAFKNASIATTLTIDIYVGGELITDSSHLKEKFGSGAYLQWRQKPEGSTSWSPIPSTDPRLSDNGFIFTLSANDVQDRTVFSCDLIF